MLQLILQVKNIAKIKKIIYNKLQKTKENKNDRSYKICNSKETL